MNVPPDRTGRINAADSVALMGFKKLRDAAFAKDLLRDAKITNPTGQSVKTTALLDHNINTYWASSTQENTTLVITLPNKRAVNTLALEEMLTYGQRVIDFTIEAFDGNAYKLVYTGTTIGRKKIASFKEQLTDKLRVTIQHAKAAPVLRGIAGYLVKDPVAVN